MKEGDMDEHRATAADKTYFLNYSSVNPCSTKDSTRNSVLLLGSF